MTDTLNFSCLKGKNMCFRILYRILLLLTIFLVNFPPISVSAAENLASTVQFTDAERQWLKSHPTIILAPDPDFKPIEYIDKNGDYRGAAADIIRLLEKKLGITISIARLKNWDEAMSKFKNQEVDLLGAMVRTPNREKFATFTDTIVAVPGGIFTRSSTKTDLTLSDLKGKKVAVVSNYTAHDVLMDKYPDIILDVVSDVSTGLAKASLGMVDAYVENMANATYYSQEAGITNLHLAGKTEFDYRWGIGIRKDWPELQGILNKGLAAISEEERQQAIKRWIFIEGQQWRPSRNFIYGAAASTLGVLLLLVGYWNYALHKMVRSRTVSLQRELDERQRAESELQSLTSQLEERVRQKTSELRASEENYRYISSLTSDFVHKCARNGSDPFRIQWVGGGIKTISGYSAEEVYEKGCWLPFVHPDDRQAVTAHLFSLTPGNRKTIAFRLITKHGETRWISETSDCTKGQKEGELLLFGASRDITERRLYEEELQMTRISVEAASDAIFWIKPDGRIVDVNPAACRSLGYSRQELLQLSVPDVDAHDNSEALQQQFPELRRHGSLKFESEHRRKDGSVFPVEIVINYVQFAGEERNCAFVRDLTERKCAEEQRMKLEQQLLHTQKLESLGVLAGGIAHDFNNILMAIMGNADLALMRINKESPAVENLHRIEQASARAADLAKQMLAYSGKGKFVIENINLNILLEEMLHMLEVSISKKAVLRLNPYTPLPTVEADATQMRQIIMNLVINASEAIGDKSGVIAITTGCMDCDRNYLKDVWLDENISEGLYVYLEIADTGCGMNKETLAKLFDPFFTTKFTGRGLGMAAVLGIVRGHKGAIKVYSEPKRGTTFKILLPASSRPAKIFNGTSHHDDWKGEGKVLLVDDEETVRGIGAEMLKELGFSVITADDGREGVEQFKQNPDISFIILDLTMPHVDGEQCFRELRQIRPDVKVIMSSGFNEQEVTQKFVGKGLAGFIQKPYKLSSLEEAIRKIY